MADTVDVAPQEDTVTPVLDPTGSTALPPPVADDRAKKASFGLTGKVQESYQDMYNKILGGQENTLRQSLAAQIALRNMNLRSEAIVGVANNLNRPLFPEDIDYIDNRLNEPDKPQSIIEEHYAKKYIDHINHLQDEPDATGWLKDIQRSHPKETEAYTKLGNRYIATKELIGNRLQNVMATMSDQSWLGAGWDIARSLIPGYAEYRSRGLVPGAESAFGMGNNIEQQTLAFFRMTPEEQSDTLDKIHTALSNNPHHEAVFLKDLIDQSNEERTWNNFSLPLDVLTIGATSKTVRALGKAAFPSLAVRDLVGSMTRSIGARAAEISAPAAAGDLDTAAIRTAADATLTRMSGGDTRQGLTDGLWSFIQGKINDVYQNPGNYGATLANQLKELYMVFGDTLEAKLTNMMTVERIPLMRAMETMMKDWKEYAAQFFDSANSKILDISVPYKDEMKLGWKYDVNLGNAYGTYFKDPEHAAYFANNTLGLPKGTYTIEGKPVTLVDEATRLERPEDLRGPMPKGKSAALGLEGPAERSPIKAPDSGSGYYIKVTRPIDETSPFIRNLIDEAIKTNNYGSKTPVSLLNTFIGGIRTPEDTMSLFARTQRGIATFGPNILQGVASKLGESITDLSKGTYPWSAKRQKWNEFKRVLEDARQTIDPETGKPGYTFKNPGELEYAYRKLFLRSPDEQEVKAYFAWKQLNEMDWTLRNLSVYRNKVRNGTMTYTVPFRDGEGNRAFTPEFDGILKENLSGLSAGKVLVIDKDGGTQIVDVASLRPGTKLGDALRSGNPAERRRVIQLYDELQRPFEGFGTVKNERIRYVVANTKERPIDFHQLPETGGGHFMYDYPYFLKQAILSKEDKGGGRFVTNYEGDKVVHAIRNRAEGKEVERRINGFRELIRDAKYDEAKEFIRNNSWGYDYDKAYQMFKPLPKRNPRTGRMMSQQPMLDVNEPIRLMDNHTTIGDAFQNEFQQRFGKDYVNGLKSGNPASINNVAFTGERDVRELTTVMDQGSKGNPVFNVHPAEMLDPITTLNRSLTNISNSYFFDDLKVGFMEHWLQEAKPYLKLRRNELQNSAVSVFHNPKWIDGNAEQMERISQLKIARQQHLNLVSRPGEQESMLMSITQHLADSIYKNFGPKFMAVPLSLQAIGRDGPRFLREMAIHTKLGMFNPAQLIKQMNTWATIYGIEGPGRASQALAAAMMHEFTRINDNPEILASMNNLLSKWGWRHGEFNEFRDILMDSGFDTVAGEYAARDNIWSGSAIRSGKQSFLNWGMSFFTEGERNVRYGAMAAAYRRFRDLHPTGALSAADKEEILQRARLLNVNMDRAANSIYQHGLSSIPFQFQTYAMRTAELMLGKRLEPMEKARLFGTYGLLYGLPVAATLPGLPVADWLRRQAIDKTNYQVGDNYLYGTLMEGVPSMISQMVSGRAYNIGQAYGSTGIGQNYFDQLKSDESYWRAALSTLGGPGGSVLANTFKNADAVSYWVMSGLDNTLKPQWADVAKIFSEWTAFRRGNQTLMALDTGNWYSKNGTKLATDVKPMESIIQFLSGLDRQDVQDAYLKGNNIEDRKQYNKETEEFFTDRYTKALQALQPGAGYNPDQAEQFFKAGNYILKMRNYPLDDVPTLMSRAMKGKEDLVKSINRSYYTTHLPAGKEQQQLDLYRRSLELGGQ